MMYLFSLLHPTFLLLELQYLNLSISHLFFCDCCFQNINHNSDLISSKNYLFLKQYLTLLLLHLRQLHLNQSHPIIASLSPSLFFVNLLQVVSNMVIFGSLFSTSLIIFTPSSPVMFTMYHFHA